jgi:hypothetical protein
MTGILTLDSPTVWPSFWGGWVVDDGSIPVHVADRRAAFAEAAARTHVPPAVDLLTNPVQPFATGSRAGSAPATRLPNVRGGNAPGSESFPQDTDPGALQDLLGKAGHRKARRGDVRPGMAGAPTN